MDDAFRLALAAIEYLMCQKHSAKVRRRLLRIHRELEGLRRMLRTE